MALLKDYAYYIDRNRIALIEKSSTTGEWDSISITGKTFRIFTKGIPAKLTTTTGMSEDATSQIPEQYQDAVLHLAISMAYLSPKNTDAEKHGIFKSIYSEELKRAKKFSRMGRRTTGFIKPQEF